MEYHRLSFRRNRVLDGPLHRPAWALPHYRRLPGKGQPISFLTGERPTFRMTALHVTTSRVILLVPIDAAGDSPGDPPDGSIPREWPSTPLIRRGD